MAVRNCAEIGENLQKIMARLMSDQTLLKLLYYTDKEPSSHTDLTQEQIKNEVYNKLIRIIPKVESKETAQSIISIHVDSGQKISSNEEFRNVNIQIEVFTPFTQWIINDTNLRPFAILGRIQYLLDGKTVNGLGKMSGGDFELAYLTDTISNYTATYNIINYV